jgi:predicted 3-demethylubiquinone-9 3-methyltransferase (glyoxalase superfamily)
LSWQVVPKILPTLIADHNDPKSQPVFAALVQMKKLDVAGLVKAYGG